MTIAVCLQDLHSTNPQYTQLVRDALQDALVEAKDSPVGIVVIHTPSPNILRRIGALAQSARVIVLLAPDTNLTTEEKLSLIASGAADVLEWPGAERLAALVVPRIARFCEIEALIDDASAHGIVVGHSMAWRQVLRQAVEIAAFSNAGLLLTGETGTGKEQIARLVHAMDRRPRKADLVTVDCTTLSRELAGSELFGHERGAFTGAVLARDGAIALANGGTLFLDEIGELDLPLQAQLLRVIQERCFKRVGGNAWQKADFRLICATNRDLEVEVSEHQFRADLYYRIADHTLHLPPLRQRRQDILPLSWHFWCLGEAAGEKPQFDPALEQILLTREYPGNVRDLRRIAMALRTRHVGNGLVSLGALPEYARPSPRYFDTGDEVFSLPDPQPDLFDNPHFVGVIERAIGSGICLKEIGRAASTVAIRTALKQEDGNLQRAARRLGVTDRALQMRRANDDTLRI